MRTMWKLLLVAPLLLTVTGCAGDPQPAPTPAPSPSPSSAAASPSTSPSDQALPDGTYTVGVEMPSGTYVAAPSGSCYWARFDSAGATIANDFTQGTRVQVTVEPGDYSFHSEGCGEWVRDTSAEDYASASANPDSPEADNTPCSLYVTVPKENQAFLVGRFLKTLRQREKIGAPPASVVATFARDIAAVCTASAEEDSPKAGETSVGLVAGVVYRGDPDEYNKG